MICAKYTCSYALTIINEQLAVIDTLIYLSHPPQQPQTSNNHLLSIRIYSYRGKIAIILHLRKESCQRFYRQWVAVVLEVVK